MRQFLGFLLLCFICSKSFAQPVVADTTPKKLLTVTEVKILGNKRTRLYIIQREMVFAQGQTITQEALTKNLLLSKQQLMNTALFVDVAVTANKVDSNSIAIQINLKERWYLFPLPYFKLVDRNFNQWWVEQKRDFSRVNYGLNFRQENFSGRNDKLILQIIAGYSTQIGFRYEQPFAEKTLKHGFAVGFVYGKNKELNYNSQLNKQLFFKQEDVYTKEVLATDLTYTYRPDSKKRHQFRFGYVSEVLNDTIAKLNPNYFGNGLTKMKFLEFTYIFQYFNVDFIPYPWKGLYVETNTHIRGFKKIFNEFQINARSSYALPLPHKFNVLFQAAASISLPTNQPFYNNKLFGYNDFVLRGMEYYVIDGNIGFFGRATLRKEFFHFNYKTGLKSKTYNKIPFRFVLKTYGDAGYAYDNKPNATSFLNNRSLYTGGLGLDVITFYDIVFKFEYSFNQFGGNGLFFHTKSDF
jgi:outer membrane protein assembly factor BamA